MGIKMAGAARRVREGELERDRIFFFFFFFLPCNHFKIAQPIFYFEMKCCVSSLMVLL